MMGTITPRDWFMWPRASGEVERQNCSLLNPLQIAAVEGKNDEPSWLLGWRCTSPLRKRPRVPHPST